MTSFLVTTSASTPGWTYHLRDDQSLCAEWSANGDLYLPRLWDNIPDDDYLFYAFFENEWWPSRSGMVGGEGAVGGERWWGHPNTRSGCNARLGITGITRDQYGSPLGFCTVKMFLTSNDGLVSSVVSDGNGVYLITTPYYPDTHYLVVYKTGSPDTFGTTVNTLIAG